MYVYKKNWKTCYRVIWNFKDVGTAFFHFQKHNPFCFTDIHIKFFSNFRIMSSILKPDINDFRSLRVNLLHKSLNLNLAELIFDFAYTKPDLQSLHGARFNTFQNGMTKLPSLDFQVKNTIIFKICVNKVVFKPKNTFKSC